MATVLTDILKVVLVVGLTGLGVLALATAMRLG